MFALKSGRSAIITRALTLNFTGSGRNTVSLDLFDVSQEVKSSLLDGKPVVALESTIITHGMPYPDNIQCAKEVEEIVRKENAVPATIAIINGRIKVGLSGKELEELGNVETSKPIKTSRRDLSYVIGNQLNGGTTVSATLIAANATGIPVFATGGIGGVHRGVAQSMDISADLIELGRSEVAVVSSGVKSILDIPKTLEYLETQGVLVATLGETSDFPAFYSRKSGFNAPHSLPNVRQAARVIHAQHVLNLESAILIAVPVPEQQAVDFAVVDANTKKALEAAKAKGVTGKDITPFLLNELAQTKQGKFLEANIALIKNNAKVAAQIAVELSKLTQPVQPRDASSKSAKDMINVRKQGEKGVPDKEGE